MISDFVPTKGACGMVLKPSTNTISMVPVVAYWKRPHLFPLTDLA